MATGWLPKRMNIFRLFVLKVENSWIFKVFIAIVSYQGLCSILDLWAKRFKNPQYMFDLMIQSIIIMLVIGILPIIYGVAQEKIREWKINKAKDSANKSQPNYNKPQQQQQYSH
jgi:hypothetical protein